MQQDGMQPDLSELPQKVLSTYKKCIESKDVLYYPSDVIPEDNPLKTEIRLCESLTRKPGPADAKKAKPKDVFDPENWDSLLVDDFDGGQGEAYGVLLNKFAVVPLHFLLVTRHWEVQTAPLTPPQLLASYQIILAFAASPLSHPSGGNAAATAAYGDDGLVSGGQLLCFYNCGPESGASQEHKHVQFAPMQGKGSIGVFPTQKAAERYTASLQHEHDKDKVFSLDNLPYAHYIRRLDPSLAAGAAAAAGQEQDSSPMQLMMHLQQVYLSLLDSMLDGLRSLPDDVTGASEDPSKIKLGRGLSYNLLLTRTHMHIIPRRRSVFKMTPSPNQSSSNLAVQTGDGANSAATSGNTTPSGKATTEPAIIGCNALAYTGTVLVKSHADAARLSEVGGVLAALEHCGYPKSTVPPVDVTQDVQLEELA